MNRQRRQQLLKRRRRKQRLRRLKQLAPPSNPMVTTDPTEPDPENPPAMPPPNLYEAYPVCVYWDNDENKFFAELSDFGECLVHGDTWLAATNAAKEAHKLLIYAYNENGYTLPEVG